MYMYMYGYKGACVYAVGFIQSINSYAQVQHVRIAHVQASKIQWTVVFSPHATL